MKSKEVQTSLRWMRVAPVAVAVALAGGAVHASHVGEELTTDQQTVASTDQLLSALRQWENAPASVREARLQQLVRMTEARKQRMLRLFEKNPRLAQLRLLPDGVRERLPAQAMVHVEQNLRLTGEVYGVVGSNPASGYTQQNFMLRANGGDYQLSMADTSGSERDLLGWAGRRVALDVTALSGHAMVRDKRSAQLVAADGATTTSTGSAVSNTTTIQGAQKTLVILTNFTDKAVSCTPAAVSNAVFGATGATVNNNYVESSGGKVTFNGQVVGPFTIPYTSSGACSYSGFASAAEAAAKAAGVDPAQFQRVSYVLAGNSQCGWSGLAYMPGRQSWINSCSATGVYSHELGHNLSLHHAGTPSTEYGDGSDPMGSASVVRHNGANMAMAGWLPYGQVVEANTSGSYSLSALELSGATSPQVIRIAKPDTAEYYYLSMRQPIGLDTSLSPSYLNRLSIHRSTGKLPAKTFLLSYLAVGGSYTDATNGISISLQALAGSVATVGVSFSGATCSRAAPTVTVNPTAKSAGPGGTIGYSVSIANRNSAACGAGTFNLSRAMPSGFSGSFALGSVSVAAGSTASTTLNVTSPSTAADGTYTFDVTAADASAATSSALEHGAYTVYRDGTPPTVAFGSPRDGASVSGRQVTLSASASDASGIGRVEFYVNGVLLGTDTSAPYSVNWNLRKAAKGPATLKLRAVDNAGNASEASIIVTVQ